MVMFATSATKIQTVTSDGVVSSAGRKMDLPVFVKTVKYKQKGSFLYDGTSSVRV